MVIPINQNIPHFEEDQGDLLPGIQVGPFNQAELGQHVIMWTNGGALEEVQAIIHNNPDVHLTLNDRTTAINIAANRGFQNIVQYLQHLPN